MYNYTIRRLSCSGVFRWCFCAGVCCGGMGGILLGIMDRSIGIFGGMFLGFIFGMVSGLLGLAYVAVFNILAPIIGGLDIYIEPWLATDAAGGAEPGLLSETSGESNNI